ncbi:hypothetical protein DSC91_006958 [Paraburkholderia caffeinilytica]|uniref:NHL repeat containing protein n=1 Tax=Paraburkholderia caffeinilytica TaxID=1761016 RepID=A0ABQ1LRI4_9BURK|nr:hypothetical protein [Paraburkholderia caffeinilytica]AXL53502.1 hypothetical protein DSC91_006958 [Paraburkholderia caffeinilytica]GGC28739.1 hypothetical protein GCM10011400_14290 [Paraburkholderia caffeinilytica]CAB3781154.1 hypothetical protein LMG28690_01117 [Paraburkholderia caffeinilytica]
MRRNARRTFERIACAGAVLLPVLAFYAALGSGEAALGPAVFAQAASGSATGAGANPAPVSVAALPSLSYRTSWIGNTWGYANQRWVQIDVQALAVTPEGDVYTNAPWDEGGGEIGHYRNGQLIGHGGQSHGWGMLGGDAIAVNGDYVFAAQLVVSLGNGMAAQKHLPPEGVVWYGVSRRRRADFREGAPFEGEVDWPGSPLAFRVITQSSSAEDYAIRGLAVDSTRLYVSNQHDNRVEIFDVRSMQPVGNFPVREPGRIAVAPDGTLWIIERSRTDGARRVAHHARNGALLGMLSLPPGAEPADLTLDSRGRLLVADNGPRQQILIFTAMPPAPAGAAPSAANATHEEASMQLSATLGEAGGIYAGRAGAPGPLRFNGLTGVGVDGAGNVYVSMNGAGPRGFVPGPGNTDGALIESYTPDGKRRFSLQGLLFVDGAQFVDGDPPSVYSGTKRFTLDLSRPTGQEWSYAGYTVDRFRYPYDPFLNLRQGQRGMPLVRDIDGRRLLYTVDMNGTWLRIYRFAADRETAIPSGFVTPSHVDGAWPPNQPPHGGWIWRDTAGQGRFAASDFDQDMARDDGPPMSGWWVDSAGAIWQGTQSQGIRRFPLQGFDRIGNPVYRYAAMQRYAMPAPFNRIARLNYFPADDTMFISGSTREHPFVEYNWNGAGSLLARYDHWTSGKPTLRYAIELPDEGPPTALSLNGFAVAGDYLFGVETETAVVRVYERDTGREAGRLKPGPEVGAASGWIDSAMPITAHRLASGEYLVFVEEDAHGKALMYRFKPAARALTSTSINHN